ncbi:hypothetical protein PR048_016189 [Dryococelus australis]|uniref:Uncharacterized protein n=1 Tax=Dryococelus australis TaxID=614101 RepID=A0ABQ9HJB8_9NEOP|nr:hypothetical protein PR048_016189 [Dryococelus australis]
MMPTFRGAVGGAPPIWGAGGSGFEYQCKPEKSVTKPCEGHSGVAIGRQITLCTIYSHHGELGSIPGRVTGFSQVGVVPDDAVGRRVFSGISRFPTPSFRRHSILTSITLIGFQDLAVNSRPNLFTSHHFYAAAIAFVLPRSSRGWARAWAWACRDEARQASRRK